jgi:Leucine-rich repeat (LRR) protein
LRKLKVLDGVSIE